MTIRERYPAIDAATLVSQSSPRSSAGIGADLFSLGVSLSRLYQAEYRAEHSTRPERMVCHSGNGTRCPRCDDITTGAGLCDVCLWETNN